MVATTAPAPRSFVPNSLDVADFSQLEPLYKQLLARPLNSTADLERYLADFSELTAVVDEYGSRRYVEKSCHTEDEAIERAYMHYVENVEPKVKPLAFAIQKKYLESPPRSQLDPKRYPILDRKWQADVE